MAKNIYDALERIIVLQAEMEITSPHPETIKHAYKYAPDPEGDLEVPGWTNSWWIERQERRVNLSRSFYTVQMQLFIAPEFSHEAADIATAFMVQAEAKFNTDVTLNGTVDRQELRGSQPTLARLERGSFVYVGLELFLDLVISQGASFS